jgi:hypothetical protein
MDNIQKQIWEVIREMNRKWTAEKNAEELKNYFHKDMVAVTATNRKRIEGRENCVASWKNFSDNAKIHFWKESEPKIQVYGKDEFAIVNYYFDMSFDMGGQTMNMKGRDMLSLVNEDGKWWIVADQFSAFPN